MKKLSLLLISVIFTITAFGQKVALHSKGNVSIFDGIAAFVNAYNASSQGDTIYLSGALFTVTGIDKSIVVYGAGHYPDSTQATGKTILNGDLNLGNNADGFKIEGVEITGNLNFAFNGTIDNVVIARCKINGSFSIDGYYTSPSKNLIFYQNIVGNSINLANAQNALLANNIISTGIVNSKNNTFINNVHLAPSNYAYWRTLYFINCDNNIIKNNIFYSACNTDNPSNVGNNNTFINNLFTQSNPYYGVNPTTIGNYENVPQSNIFINVSSATFSYAFNYHLQNPGTYLGDDGTQIGIYGGLYPYKEGAVPSNPHIQFQNIAPTTSNGMLNIQIKAAAQDH